MVHGCRQLRVVRCWVKSRNERNPLSYVTIIKLGDSCDTACDEQEEGGDDVKSSCPLYAGLHTCYNGWYKEEQNGDVEQN